MFDCSWIIIVKYHCRCYSWLLLLPLRLSITTLLLLIYPNNHQRDYTSTWYTIHVVSAYTHIHTYTLYYPFFFLSCHSYPPFFTSHYSYPYSTTIAIFPTAYLLSVITYRLDSTPMEEPTISIHIYFKYEGIDNSFHCIGSFPSSLQLSAVQCIYKYLIPLDNTP
jgi:hypothetical protein